MRSHTVTLTRHLAAVTFPLLLPPQLLLDVDLATPEGCKAELTWVVVIFERRKTVTISEITRWWVSGSRTHARK